MKRDLAWAGQEKPIVDEMPKYDLAMPPEPDPVVDDAPLATWAVPGITPGSVQPVTARPGEVTVVVGANGAGKSALGLWMQQNAGNAKAKRLIAHRRLWFASAGPDISPAQRAATSQHMESWSREPDSRYLDHADSQRAAIVLFDILALMNGQNSRIADLALSGADLPQIRSAEGERILDRLNSILKESGLPAQLKLTDLQTFNAVNAVRGAEYPIFQMSDGEKSAVLLAAEVLSASGRCVLIIDEPERHLHRSISSGLVEAVVASRPDCHFVVLTHDLELASALSSHSNQSFVLTDCVWAGSAVSSWALFPIDASEGTPENVRKAILGGRQNLLFVEGEPDSLDIKLYGLLFPLWTVTPSGGAEQVIRAVAGLQASQQHHWATSRGIIDGDGRTEEERRAHLSRGVLSLPVSEIESLYYLSEVVSAVAESQALTIDGDAQLMKRAAREAALNSLRGEGTPERMASKLALAEVRRKMAEALPSTLGAETDPVEFSVASPFSRILAAILEVDAANDLDGLIRLLPIRDTPLRSRVASALGFRTSKDYEAAVRVRVKLDPELAEFLRGIVGPLPLET